MKILTKLAVVALTFIFFIIGCGVDNHAEEEKSKISKQEAMQIALEYVDNESYEATSALLGSYSKISEVEVWSVNLLNEDNVMFVYIDARSGEVYDEEIHELLEDVIGDQNGVVPKSGGMCAGYCHWYLYVNIPGFYSQLDYHWANRSLGNSRSTIGRYGCHLTTVSMILYRLGHRDRNPLQLNDYAKIKGCFNGDLLKGPCIMQKHGRNGKNIGVNEIWGYLQRGIPVVAAVNYGTGMHFMLIYGFDGSRYWVKDPLKDGNHQDQPLYGENSGAGTFRVYN